MHALSGLSTLQSPMFSGKRSNRRSVQGPLIPVRVRSDDQKPERPEPPDHKNTLMLLAGALLAAVAAMGVSSDGATLGDYFSPNGISSMFTSGK